MKLPYNPRTRKRHKINKHVNLLQIVGTGSSSVLTGKASITVEFVSDCELRSLSFSEIVPFLVRRGGAGKTVISPCGGDPPKWSGKCSDGLEGICTGDAGTRGDIFKKSSTDGPFVSIGDIFKKLRSFGISAMGSPIAGEGGASFSDATEETVTKGGEPGKELGGPTDALRVPGLDGALFIRNLSLIEYLVGTEVSDGVGGRGPVGGGTGGDGRWCFEVELPVATLRRRNAASS